MKIVEVIWKDPTIDSGWQDEDHHNTLPDIKSYGILIYNTKKQVCIAGTYDPDQQKYADRTRFPKGCVSKVRVIYET